MSMMAAGAAAWRRAGGGAPSDPVAAAILAKLTSWWEMGEGSGTRSDSHGSNHLSTVGTVSTGQGARGVGDVAAEFAGSGALSVADNDTLDTPAGGGDHCLFGWAYFNANSGTQFMAAKWDATNAWALQYAIQNFAATIYAQNGDSSYRSASDSAPTAATWNFYMLWRDSTAGPDSGKVRLQVNAGSVAMSAAASNPQNTTSPLAFGQAGSSATNRMSGRLQRWGWIKGDILTPTERAWLYNGGSGRTYAEIVIASSP